MGKQTKSAKLPKSACASFYILCPATTPTLPQAHSLWYIYEVDYYTLLAQRIYPSKFSMKHLAHFSVLHSH